MSRQYSLWEDTFWNAYRLWFTHYLLKILFSYCLTFMFWVKTTMHTLLTNLLKPPVFLREQSLKYYIWAVIHTVMQTEGNCLLRKQTAIFGNVWEHPEQQPLEKDHWSQALTNPFLTWPVIPQQCDFGYLLFTTDFCWRLFWPDCIRSPHKHCWSWGKWRLEGLKQYTDGS